MQNLPVIIGMGGVNAAGRTSGHHGYRRMVLDSLPEQLRQETLQDLAVMMGLIRFEGDRCFDAEGSAFDLAELEARYGELIRESTLVRRVSEPYFDPDATPWQSKLTINPTGQPLEFETKARQLPEPLPEGWQVEPLDDKRVRVRVEQATEMLVASRREFPYKAAGLLPAGFDPKGLYNSRFQPRGLQLTVFGASDAIASTGLPWEQLRQTVRPEQVGVYAGSGMGQLDENGYGGLLQSRLHGERVSSKQLAMGLNTMPTDFVSAYVLGNVGSSTTSVGACATFLFNLQRAVEDIKSGKVRLAVVGNAEAPVNSCVMDGYGTMGALATDDQLRKLDGLSADQAPDYRRASRPFGENCGFTIGESAQFFVLCDDALAIELGAQVLGSVADVFINADGFKKSITAPGIGNYLTFARAVASGEAIVGREAMQQGSFVLAHGSSTPQNRVTESRIFDRVAEAFDIQDWPVAAVKAYVGHSLGPASGDQLAATLGVFEYGLLPGIKTIDKVADDVYQQRLNIPTQDLPFDKDKLSAAILNSKGFGGNNASALVLSPAVTHKMLAKRYGQEQVAQYQDRAQQVREAARAYDQQASRGEYRIRYHFGEGLIDEEELRLDDQQLQVPGFDQLVHIKQNNPYTDMC